MVRTLHLYPVNMSTKILTELPEHCVTWRLNSKYTIHMYLHINCYRTRSWCNLRSTQRSRSVRRQVLSCTAWTGSRACPFVSTSSLKPVMLWQTASAATPCTCKMYSTLHDIHYTSLIITHHQYPSSSQVFVLQHQDWIIKQYNIKQTKMTNKKNKCSQNCKYKK